MIGADKRVMFSSDYIHWDFDNPMMDLPPRIIINIVLKQGVNPCYN